jgi:hypothetical protein
MHGQQHLKALALHEITRYSGCMCCAVYSVHMVGIAVCTVAAAAMRGTVAFVSGL